MEKHRITALPVVDDAGRAGRRAQRARPAARRSAVSARSTSDLAQFQAHCVACACWCSTWTACSPTAGCSTGRKGEAAQGISRARRPRHQASRRGRHHRRHHFGAQVGGRRAPRARTRHPPRYAGRERQARRAAQAREGARVALEDCACVGDDTPDAPILAAAGLGIAVADAHQDALAAADLVTTRRRRSRRGARGLRLADRGAQGCRMKAWRLQTRLVRTDRGGRGRLAISSARQGATTMTPIRRAPFHSIRATRRATPKSSKPVSTDASATGSRPLSSASRPSPASSTSNTWRWTTTAARRRAAGRCAADQRGVRGEVWHLTSDHGQVRAEGDDVQLTGNVRVTGPAPGGGEPLSLTTETLRINTPTEFIETDAPGEIALVGPRTRRRGHAGRFEGRHAASRIGRSWRIPSAK